MISVKKHYSEHSEVVSLCDSDLLGKCFEDKKLCLNISKRFYEGELLKEKEILPLIEERTVLNIVGKESIKFAIKHKFINKENIITIQNVPHAQVY
jgi:hypothetical protein